MSRCARVMVWGAGGCCTMLHPDLETARHSCHSLHSGHAAQHYCSEWVNESLYTFCLDLNTFTFYWTLVVRWYIHDLTLNMNLPFREYKKLQQKKYGRRKMFTKKSIFLAWQPSGVSIKQYSDKRFPSHCQPSYSPSANTRLGPSLGPASRVLSRKINDV